MRNLHSAFILAALIYALLLNTAVAQTQYSGIEPRKLDESGWLGTDDMSARLDYFGEELRKDPNLRGYIVGYNDEHFLPGQFLRRIYGDQRYLTKYRGLEIDRIVVLNGGYRKQVTTELWLVPMAASPPTLIPDSLITIKGKQKPYKFDSEYLDNEPAVDLDQSIKTGEGVEHYARALMEMPNSQAWIIVYPNHIIRRRMAASLARKAKRLLISQQKIKADRVKVIVGGNRSNSTLNYWVVPAGAQPPRL